VADPYHSNKGWDRAGNFGPYSTKEKREKKKKGPEHRLGGIFIAT